jgi:outer membrane receptor for ferrienterochelin and colicins
MLFQDGILMRNYKPLYMVAALTALSMASQAAELPMMEEVLVVSTATRTARPIDSITASMQVIQASDIERIGAQTVKEIFANTPGLTLQYGTFPSASSASKSSVSLRGMGANGTLWLLDGRRLSGEVTNPYDMDRLPASMIERIEVVKGPMSALYGADAVGGVINIITRTPEPGLEGDIGVRFGSNNEGDADTINFNGNIRGGSERLLFSIYASQQSTDPYTELENTSTRLPVPVAPPPLQGVKDSYEVPVSYREESLVRTVGGRLAALASEKLTLGLEFNWLEEEREGRYRAAFHPTGFSPLPGLQVPAFDVPVRSVDDNTRLDIAADLRFEFSEYLSLDLRAYLSDYRKRNNTTMIEYADFAFPSEEASAIDGLKANVEIESVEALINWSVNEAHLLTVGGELRREVREATAFSQSTGLATREVAYQALFLQDEWAVTDTLDVTLGARYDGYNQDEYVDSRGNQRQDAADSEVTWRIGAVQRFSDAFSLRANYAQGYRVPDIRELFIQKRTPMGYQLGAQAIEPLYNKQAQDLAPETVDSYELALSGSAGRFGYETVVFYNDVQNLIQQVAVDATGNGSDDYLTFMNVSNATTYGLETNLGYTISDAASITLAWTELRTENEETGEDLEFNPERVVALRMDWQVLSRLALGISVNYTGKQYYVADEQEQTAPDYALINLNLGYTLDPESRWQLYAGANNIFDQEVDKRLGSNPGPFLFIGLRGTFE